MTVAPTLGLARGVSHVGGYPPLLFLPAPTVISSHARPTPSEQGTPFSGAWKVPEEKVGGEQGHCCPEQVKKARWVEWQLLGATPADFQGLLLDVCSWLTTDSVRGTL